MASLGFDELDVYKLAEALADAVWEMVTQWDRLAQRTLGEQIVRSADSVGANIAEGTGGNAECRMESAECRMGNDQ